MSLDEYFHDAMAHNNSLEETKFSCEKLKSFSNDSDSNPSGGFDCNICLDTVHDPVVTLCGHLFCWPCMYRWLCLQSTPSEHQEQQQQCPVCKAEVSQASLIPLYGRGQTTKPSKGKARNLGITIPKRPLGPFSGADSQRTPSTTASPLMNHQFYHRYPHQSQLSGSRRGSYAASPVLSPGGITTNLFDPTIGIFGDMIYARFFGNSITNLYTYPNRYHLPGSASSRVRRRVMQADKSLGRICFFLFCCSVLCLLLF